jgi:hypothetical protein
MGLRGEVKLGLVGFRIVRLRLELELQATGSFENALRQRLLGPIRFA